jgi:hypothetical protein
MLEPNTELILPVLINGAIFATIAVIVPAFLLSRFARDIIGRSVLVIFLVVTAGAYFGFATVGRDLVGSNQVWILIELAQAVVFGAIGLLGLRGSPYWIAAGWALHPFWDFVVHYIGPGHTFTPWTYAIACVSFDWIIAIYIVVTYGVVGGRRLGFREVATA